MRQMILSKTVLASIPALVEQGLNKEAIAARLGCKVSTLKVRCSQAQVSLTLRPARIVHIARNLLRALGCEFIEPIDELGTPPTFHDETV